MNKKITILLGISALVLLIVIATVAYNVLSSKNKQNEGIMLAQGEAAVSDTTRQTAPDFAMMDMDGNAVRLSGVIAKGKPIVLNFWQAGVRPAKLKCRNSTRFIWKWAVKYNL
jgi:cytochrome oxidase Cu insertion factor (SCO1/SenC/PrrC family)